MSGKLTKGREPRQDVDRIVADIIASPEPGPAINYKLGSPSEN